MMLMLCVTTPGDPTTAHAKKDFIKMEKHAQVTNYLYVTQCGLISSDLGKLLYI